MGAARFDGAGRTRAARRSSTALKVPQRGQQILVEQQRRRHMNRRRHDVIAALSHVHVIVRVHRSSPNAGPPESRSPRWRSCCCWCPNRSETRPRGTDRRVAPSATSRAAAWIAAARSGRQVAQFRIRRRRRALDQSERADEGTRHGEPRGGEILDCTLRLGAPQRRSSARRAHPCCHARRDSLLLSSRLLRRSQVVYGNILSILPLSDGIS